jgi:hypothetical protein
MTPGTTHDWMLPPTPCEGGYCYNGMTADLRTLLTEFADHVAVSVDKFNRAWEKAFEIRVSLLKDGDDLAQAVPTLNREIFIQAWVDDALKQERFTAIGGSSEQWYMFTNERGAVEFEPYREMAKTFLPPEAKAGIRRMVSFALPKRSRAALAFAT